MAITRCVAKALILDQNGDFLLLQRSDTHPRLGGFYDLPGGTIEDNEQWRDGVIREIREETGLELTHERLKALYTTTKLLHGRSYPTILYVAYVDGNKPAVNLSWEHKSYEWAPLERLGDVEPQLAPTYREALEYIRANDILQDIAEE